MIWIRIKSFRVSIHAPTKGATFLSPHRINNWRVSIHAPTKGATSNGSSTQLQLSQFQSTHPQRVRRRGRMSPRQGVPVSIHAPTKGATVLSTLQGHGVTCFNPRTHKGCDPTDTIPLLPLNGFNPRTHKGCDRVRLGK